MLSPLAWVLVRWAERLLAAVLLLIAASVGALGQTEEGRVALVLGNGQYVHTPPLANPPRDARAVAEALRRLGFQVLEGINLDLAATQELLRQFATRLEGADVGLFYYAGHGVQVFGRNYLAPVDAELNEQRDLFLKTVDLELVLSLLEAAPRTSLIFLDASRDNPLARNLARSLGTAGSRAVGRGLAPVDSGIGTIIVYATGPNNLAYDGTGEHSPFTEAVLEYIDRPGLEVRQMLSRVRETVIESTDGRQVPWDHSSLTADFYFVPETQMLARLRLRETAQEELRAAPGRSVTASRLFAGPNQYPPEDFAAYGVLAFRSRASSQDRSRHLLICDAYISSLPHVSELRIGHSEQMVTVWPADSDAIARIMNEIPRRGICEAAVERYGLVTSHQALKDAEAAGVDLSDVGPYLLAWSPSRNKGKKDALVLVTDLSDVTTYRQAQEILTRWSRDIEQNPELWRNGWDIEKLREQIRLWVDEYGPKILVLFGVKE